MGLYDQLVIGVLILTLIYGSSVRVVEAQSTNFSYPYFNSPEYFLPVSDVQYYADKYSYLLNPGAYSMSDSSCGRLYYGTKVRMKDAASGAVASFQTAFTFSVWGTNYWVDQNGLPLHGDGMAFLFARNSSALGDMGGSLCLLKAGNDGLASNELFAVEFDTFQNPEYNDSSNNHIGVNINSMVSKWSYNLCGGSVFNCTYLVNGSSFTTWIDYESTTQKLAVYFAKGTLSGNNVIAKPPKPVIEATQSLTDLLDEYMYVGFSSAVGTYNEVHQIQSWQFSSFGMPLEQVPVVVEPPTAGITFTSRSKVGIIVGVCAGVGGALLLVGFCIVMCRRRASSTKQGTFNLVDQNLVPRMFTYKELSKATKNFSQSELLGTGGFGAVYKGVLPSGALVAVKRLRHEGEHGEEGFQAEAASLSQIRHRNLVQLRGWCHEEEQLLLVYDFMCNGSLDEWLFQFSKQKRKGPMKLNAAEALPLELRLSILSGVAGALSYLHEECKQCVLHRDIKCSNVLLDEHMNAYLGDFGLARLIDHQKMEKTTMMAGTLGYMAPEMPHTGRATKESDVYSFGVLMLEVMCGMRSLDMNAIERGDGTLVDRAWRAHATGSILLVADVKLGAFSSLDGDSRDRMEVSSLLMPGDVHDLDRSVVSVTLDAGMEDGKLVANLLRLGLLCCNPNPKDRPCMRLVAQVLQAPDSMEMALPALPRFKPPAQYSVPGFSQMAMIRSTSTSSHVDNVEEAGQGSSQSTPPSSGGEHSAMPASVATLPSSVFSGR